MTPLTANRMTGVEAAATVTDEMMKSIDDVTSWGKCIDFLTLELQQARWK